MSFSTVTVSSQPGKIHPSGDLLTAYYLQYTIGRSHREMGLGCFHDLMIVEKKAVLFFTRPRGLVSCLLPFSKQSLFLKGHSARYPRLHFASWPCILRKTL